MTTGEKVADGGQPPNPRTQRHPPSWLEYLGWRIEDVE